MLWFKFIFNFSNQFDLYFLLSRIRYHNLKQREIKIKLVCKPKIDLNHNIYVMLHNFSPV